MINLFAGMIVKSNLEQTHITRVVLKPSDCV